MKCPRCQGPVQFPPYGQSAVCVPCNSTFELIADYGFFNYQVLVFAAKDDEDGKIDGAREC